MKPLHVLVEEEQHEWVYQTAKDRRMSMGEVVREMLVDKTLEEVNKKMLRDIDGQ